MIAYLLSVLISAPFSHAGEPTSLFQVKDPISAANCTEMKQSLERLLNAQAENGIQQSAKFSILNTRLLAYKDACGPIDEDLAVKIFQKM